MMLTEEELRDSWHEQYLHYCKTNPSAKTIVACHTKVFKQLNALQVRHMGYWWLRYKYGFASYYNDHKIPDSLVVSINQALTTTVQTGYTEENLFRNLSQAFTNNRNFFDYVYDCHVRDQEIWNKCQAKAKLKMEKDKPKDYTNILAVILIICICLLIAFFYVR